MRSIQEIDRELERARQKAARLRKLDVSVEDIERQLKRRRITEQHLIAQFQDAGLILMEGFDRSFWPKLELVRAGNSAQSVCDPTTMLALVTDTDLRVPGIPTLCLNDPARVADFLMKYLERRRST